MKNAPPPDWDNVKSSEPFKLTPSPEAAEEITEHFRDRHAPPKALRQRNLYWVPAGQWVGFGRSYNPQPDLFESFYRFGWWRVAVCKVCLVAVVRNANSIIEQVDALLAQPRKRIGK